MKNIFLILLFVSDQVNAESLFMCWPHEKATRIFFEKIDVLSDKMLTLHVTQPSGYEFLTQMSGPVSKFQMPQINQQFKELESLGQKFDISWPIQNCQINEKEFEVNCDGEVESSVDKIKALTLSTVRVNEIKRQKEYKKNKYILSLEKEGMFYTVELEFQNETCTLVKK